MDGLPQLDLEKKQTKNEHTPLLWKAGMRPRVHLAPTRGLPTPFELIYALERTRTLEHARHARDLRALRAHHAV